MLSFSWLLLTRPMQIAVKGMQLVTELERDLQVSSIIVKVNSTPIYGTLCLKYCVDSWIQ